MSRQLFVPKRVEANVVEVGDANYVEYSFQRREAVKANDELLGHIHFLWDLVTKDSTGRVHQTAYLDFFQLVAYVVVTNSTIESARELANRDWPYDARGRDSLNLSDFVDAVFDICDLFCPYTDSHEYCVFLMDVRRSITVPDLDDSYFQATAVELQPLLKEVVPHRWRAPSELKKLSLRAIDATTTDADALLRNHRNGDWITGFPISLPEWKALSFKAVICAFHKLTYGAFSQKLHATTKGQLESEYRLHQAKQPMPRMMREPSKAAILGAIAAAKPTASALQIPFMTDRIRPEVWDPEVANLLQNITPRPGICVVGPPRSGKTRLATALAKELGVMYFSIPQVLEIAAKTAPPPPDAVDISPRQALYAAIRETLLTGLTVSREDAVSALLYHMVETLSGSQGFLVDDLYPHDAWGSDAFLGLHFSHVVCLTGSQANCVEHVASISFCPKRRLMYSARDVAQFTGVVGFADSYVEPVAAAPAPPAPAAKPLVSGDDEGDDMEDVDADEDIAKDAKAAPVDPLAPFRFPRQSLEYYATYALPVNQDRVLNVGNLWLQTLEADYTAYERSVAKTLATVPADTQVVRIVFHQSPGGILQQAVGAITGSRPPLSRLPPSLSVVPVELPPDVQASSRGDQIRWLLYGDWAPLVQDGGALAPVKHLVPPTEPRKLSVFRGFCPVDPSHHGQPAFAAVFSGRVYLLSSAEALRTFRVSPQSFLERVVSPLNELRLPRLQTHTKRLWLIVATTSLPASFSLPRVAAIVAADIALSSAKDAVVEPCEVLSASQDPDITTKLRAGEKIPHDVVTKEVLQRLVGRGQEPWIVHGLPLVATTWTSMKELGVLPEAILVFDPPPPGPDDPAPTNQEKEHRATVQALLAVVAADNTTTIPVAVDAPTTDDDILVALHRRLDPWYPNRLDADEDGGSSSAIPPISPLEEAARKQWGETGSFCPVTYATAPLWRLVPGKPAEWVSYMKQRTYSFAGAAEKAAFDRNPRKYIPQTASTTFRPVVLLLGPSSSGRRSVAQALEERLHATSFQSSRVLESFDRLVAIEKFNAGTGDDEDIDDAIKVQHYGTSLASEWAAVDGAGSAPYVLPGFGYSASRIPSPELLALCVARKWFPFVVVPMQLDAATAVHRKMQAWVYTPPKPSSDDDEDAPKEEPKEKAARLAAEEAAAREEETARVTEAVTAELEAYTTALEFFKEQGVRISDVVDANRGPQRVVKDVVASLLKAGLANMANVFCQPEVTPLERVQTLVTAGYWTMGHHGPHCPVVGASHRSTDPLPSQVCAAYRGRVYVPSDFGTFAAAPWTFASQTTRPTVPGVAVAVVGGPRSGQTTVAKGLSARYGAIYVSPHEAFQWIYACQRGTTLWTHVKDFKTSRDTAEFDLTLVTDALLLQVVVARIRSFECQQRGWVLDGFPTNATQWAAWEKVADSSVLPSTVVWVDGSPYTLLSHDGQQHGATSLALLKRIKTWQAARVPLLIAMAQTYGVGFVKTISVDGKSAWKVVAEAHRAISDVVDATAKYWQALASHRPAPTYNVRLAQSQVQLHPTIAAYCPVGRAGQRAVLSHQLDREYIVEYQSFHYYLAHADSVSAFVTNAGKVLSAAAAVIPPMARDVSTGTLLCHGINVALGFQGYCPVTYKDGSGPSDWSSIRKGCPYILAALNQTIYCFVDHAAKHRFLLEPSLYAALELPTKLPPLVDAAPLNVTIPGRLEQALTRVTEEAMVALGTERFKFPFVSTQASAVMYVALFLKAKKKFSNQQHQDSPRQVQALLQNFVDDCRLGQDIKELTAPVGSAVKGVRTIREKGGGSDILAKNARFDTLVAAPQAAFRVYAARGLEK